jgi:hypothetical protein
LGYVIIIKDISKLHRAQKKAAWGEVAMRMAHEIKNPLTPIFKLNIDEDCQSFLPLSHLSCCHDITENVAD